MGILFFIFAYAVWAISNLKAHNFEGKCLMCHTDIPDKDAKRESLSLVDEVDKLCSNCHAINQEKSHPINVVPKNAIPLAAHLDKLGRLTCTTCHDVHKEDKTSDRIELKALLWGHAKAKAFCFLCHNKQMQEVNWRHQTSAPYAHPYGKLIENSSGSLLDRFSVDCLSCHDGTVSKFPRVQVKEGIWQHGIGMSHPIGIDYPRSGDFTHPESLPKEVRLFDAKVGCLSCHDIYSKEQDMLVMSNKKSKLCLSCHKK